MIERIEWDRLKPGMHAVDAGIDWLKEPYGYSRFQLLDAETIENLRKEGYLYAFIDTSLPGQAGHRAGQTGNATVAPAVTDKNRAKWQANRKEAMPLKRQIPLQKELVVARSTYKNCLKTARNYIDGARRGEQIDCSSAEPVVEEIMGSITRNPDALYSIAKLRVVDDYTYSHCVNVAVLGIMFSKYLGFSAEVQREVGTAALFHDLGKARVPLEILNAPRKLTDEEFSVIQNHARLGYEQLKNAPDFTDDILNGVLEHHERHDGSGYPHGLAGEQISPVARILSVVDVYDALTSRRVYKKTIPSHQVLAMIFQQREKDFYPGLAEHFAKMVGIYPVGSVVRLNDGSCGVVSGSNPERPTRPVIIQVLNARGIKTPAKEIDLLDSGLEVQRCLMRTESIIDPYEVLGITTTG